MQKIILLTGGGDLPTEVIKTLKKKKITFYCIAFKNNPISKEILKYENNIINFGNVVTELKKLKLLGFHYVLMIGNLQRPNFGEIKPDINAISLIPQLTRILLRGGDNNLLNFVSNQLKKFGFKLLDLKKLIPELFLGKGNQTKIKFLNKKKQDIKKGKLILNSLSKFDVGQSIIIQNGTVIGIEAAQGTDELIKNAGLLLTKGQEGTLIKIAKLKQNLRVDLPTIGLETLKNCKKNNVNGIAYSANKTIFIKKQKIIDYCNKHKIFLFGI